MFSIVFIDDEPWTLDDLCSIIDWSAYGFTETKAFSDPVKAAGYIRKNKPDAVCTDIRMPELSGLDLIAECKPECPETLFSVISAYAEFEFARRAIREGAFSFLLKPLIENDVRKLAEQMAASLAEKRERTLRQSIRSLTVGILLSSKEDPGKILNMADSGLFQEPYTAVVSDVSLGQQLNGEWFRVYDDLFVGILPGAAPSFPEYVLCGYRSSPGASADIASCIRAALLDYFTLRFYKVQSGVLESAEEDPGKWENILAALLNGVKEHNEILIAEKLREIEDSAARNLTSIQTLNRFYGNILSALLEKSGQAELRENFKKFANAFQMYSVFRDHKVFFHSIRLLLDNIDFLDDGSSSNEDLSSAIVSYVDSHFTESVTLESLSERFNVSLSQISRYFKKETGVSYITYLTQKRIRRACQLLSQTNCPITEISNLVGYSDYFYFAKKFKSIMTETPSQFRMRQNGKPE